MTKKEVEELIAKIKEVLPENVKLHFETIDPYLTIKPEGFLGSENFSKLNAKIQELGGEYISAGKNSHLRISLEPKEESLKEWYTKESLKQKPLTANLTLNLNLQVSTIKDLEDILNILKNHIGR